MKINKCFLTSTSDIKRSAVESTTGITFECIDTSACGNPEQPVGKFSGMLCCKERIKWLLENTTFEDSNNTLIWSIENAIEKRGDKCYDVVHFMQYSLSEEEYFYHSGTECEFPKEFWDEALNSEDNVITPLGWSVTIGDIFKKHFDCNPKDWISHVSGPNVMICDSRKSQIINELTRNDDDNESLIANVNYIQNFPKPGILFKDFSPLLSNSNLLDELADSMVQTITDSSRTSNVDYVIGLESRGFILGSMLALKMNIGFIMIRKSGKLPPPVISADYVKEYGTDTFDISLNAFPKGRSFNVWLADDLLSTGGSLACAIELIRKLNETRPEGTKINVGGCITVLQVDELKVVANEALKGTTVKVVFEQT
jgi:adenine phosphoribosyltransferase